MAKEQQGKGYEISLEPDSLLTLAELEHRYIRAVLGVMDGNKARSARALGIDRRTLYRKLEK